MHFAGFQPLSLIDYPGMICSILFTQGCPFRCVYCHNPELIPVNAPTTPSLEEEVVVERLMKHRNMIEGVCITGGEPTLHPDLPTFIRRLQSLGFLVKLDTNGVHPAMVEALLRDQQVDYVAMDLKHTWERYAEVIGQASARAIENCKQTMKLLQESGIAHEFRTTVYPALHAAEDLEGIASQLKEGERYFLQGLRYEKTLQPGLPRAAPLDLAAIAIRIRERYPGVVVEVR